jgi:hypothetical protein
LLQSLLLKKPNRIGLVETKTRMVVIRRGTGGAVVADVAVVAGVV